MTKPLRIAFMGTPDFAVKALEVLIASNHEVVCVYSQPPRPKGRGQKLQSSPVHQCAEKAGIEVRTPLNFKNSEDIENFENLHLDVAIVAAYGLILPQKILEAPQYGCINIHASLLPRWRGAAPIQRSIWAGDTQTGITLMQMDVGLDTGDMIAVEKTPITPDTTCLELHDSLSHLGAQMIIPCLNQLAEHGVLEKTPQPETGMTYAKMLSKQDGHIDWTQSAKEIDRQVRALNPWPGTWCFNQNQKRLKILEVEIDNYKTELKSGTIFENGLISCGNRTVLKLKMIQPENKTSMDIQTAMNGNHIKLGDIFS